MYYNCMIEAHRIKSIPAVRKCCPLAGKKGCDAEGGSRCSEPTWTGSLTAVGLSRHAESYLYKVHIFSVIPMAEI